MLLSRRKYRLPAHTYVQHNNNRLHMYVQGIQKHFLWKTFVHLIPLLALHIICLDFRNTVPDIYWEINCNIDIFIFQDNNEEAIAMSASSNAFKASRTEDNDNHAAVANIKGQYLLLDIQRMNCDPACAHVRCAVVSVCWKSTLKQVAHAQMPIQGACSRLGK